MCFMHSYLLAKQMYASECWLVACLLPALACFRGFERVAFESIIVAVACYSALNLSGYRFVREDVDMDLLLNPSPIRDCKVCEL